MKPTYESPLASRYASRYMLHLFSPDSRFETWRKLWGALARGSTSWAAGHAGAGRRAGSAHRPIDYDIVSKKEKEIRHDVMAHIYAYVVWRARCKGHHPSGRDELLCDRQRRPDPVPRRASLS